MHSGKQVTEEPQKKVGDHEKGRKEEGKGGKPAVFCRLRLQPGLAPPYQPKVGMRYALAYLLPIYRDHIFKRSYLSFLMLLCAEMLKDVSTKKIQLVGVSFGSRLAPTSNGYMKGGADLADSGKGAET